MRAKAYYIEAEKDFELKKYNEALKSLVNVEKVLGSTNARVLGLKVKVLYKLEKYYEAREALNQFSKYKSSSSLQSEILPYVVKVDGKIAEIEEEIIRKKQEQREKELAKIRQQQQIKALAEKMKPEIWATYNKFKSLEEGKPYLVTYRKGLTSSDDEKTILFFYGDQYIAYTIPSVYATKRLFKDKVYYGSIHLTGMKKDIARIKRGKHKDLTFRESRHYRNIYLGGRNNDLLWTEGSQYNQFDQDLFFYSYGGVLMCDVKMVSYRDKLHYNPFIETGKIELSVDYRIIRDEQLKEKLRMSGVKDKKASLDNPVGLQVELQPQDNMKMLFPQKKITYQLQDRVKVDIFKSNTQYRGEVLYYSPLTTKNHYGYIQFNTSYPERNLFTAIKGFSSSYRLSKKYFDLIYESFSEDIGKGKTRYFTSTGYRFFFEDIPEIADGELESINYDTSITGSNTK